jgi:acyl-CoA thioester hydrolase
LKFSIDLPVQFRDIDVMGHVNNATYFQYMETGRVELARKLG